MYATHPCMVIDPCAKYGKVMSKRKKKLYYITLTCQISYKFDLEVKGQCHIGIMKVCDTSSHDDTFICQIW